MLPAFGISLQSLQLVRVDLRLRRVGRYRCVQRDLADCDPKEQIQMEQRALWKRLYLLLGSQARPKSGDMPVSASTMRRTVLIPLIRARDNDKDGPGRMQILHYNIDRFPNDIKDLRGLETLLVAS